MSSTKPIRQKIAGRAYPAIADGPTSHPDRIRDINEASLEAQRARLFNALGVIRLACAKLDSEDDLDADARESLVGALMLVESEIGAVAEDFEPVPVGGVAAAA